MHHAWTPCGIRLKCCHTLMVAQGVHNGTPYGAICFLRGTYEIAEEAHGNYRGVVDPWDKP